MLKGTVLLIKNPYTQYSRFTNPAERHPAEQEKLSQLSYVHDLFSCHPSVTLCHPLKRCKRRVHRGFVSLSPFLEKFL